MVLFLSRAQGNVDTRILQGCAWMCHCLAVLTKLAVNKVHILLSFATDCVFFFANVQWITLTKLPDPELPWALMSFLSFKDFAAFCYPPKSAAVSQTVRTTWHKPIITSGEAGRTLAGTFNDKMPSSQSLIHPEWKKNERMRYGISLFHKMLGFTSFHILVCALSLIMCIYLQRSLKQVNIGFRLKIFYIGRINGLSMCRSRIGDFIYNLCNAALLSATHTLSLVEIVEWTNSWSHQYAESAT